MRKPEVTSARVAKIAARILAADYLICYCVSEDGSTRFTRADLRAVAASVLTQREPNKSLLSKRKRKSKRE